MTARPHTPDNQTTQGFIVAAFYKFARLSEIEAIRDDLAATCKTVNTSGIILVAPEGVNGTIAGSREGIDSVLERLRQLPGCADIEHKEATADENPFYRMKVRLKREIVTMGQPDVEPDRQTGHYVSPEDWNDLISDPDVVVIDTRNDYEVAIGTFEGAIDPKTKSFSEFPSWFENNAEELKPKKFAMFCTGGIRCEKASAWIRAQGIEEIYQLKGGILKYLETVPQDQSRWQGECFVFDQRVAVGHGLKQGSYGLCPACRRPLGKEDYSHPDYVRGVSCSHCVNETSQEQKARFAARQKQMDLANARGTAHIGSQASSPSAHNDD